MNVKKLDGKSSKYNEIEQALLTYSPKGAIEGTTRAPSLQSSANITQCFDQNYRQRACTQTRIWLFSQMGRERQRGKGGGTGTSVDAVALGSE